MKTSLLFVVLTSLASTGAGLFAAESPPPPERAKVGIYDSRAVAYAHFWSSAEQARIKTLADEVRAAQKTGDKTRFQALDSQLETAQKRAHQLVFDAAPASEALTALAPRLPALQKEWGVTRIVSKWDEKALRQVPPPERIDVTDRLVREFIVPTDRQQKTLDAIKAAAPPPPTR